MANILQIILYWIFVFALFWTGFGQQVEQQVDEVKKDDSSQCAVAPNIYITVYQGQKENNYSQSLSNMHYKYNLIKEASKNYTNSRKTQSDHDAKNVTTKSKPEGNYPQNKEERSRGGKSDNVASASGGFSEMSFRQNLQRPALGTEFYKTYANENLNKVVNIVESAVVDDMSKYKLNLEIFEMVQKNYFILKGMQVDMEKQRRRSVNENRGNNYIYPEAENYVKPIDVVMREVFSPLDSTEDLLFNIERLGMRSFLRVMHSTGLKEKLKSKNHTCTIFVPTDQAFRRLDDDAKRKLKNLEYLTQVLLFHVADGYHHIKNFGFAPVKTLNNESVIRTTRLSGTISLQGSGIVSGDNLASNGLIHVIDSILLPPSKTLLEIIKSNPSLKAFAKLVKEANMEHILNSSMAYTVFAPSNFAFKDTKEHSFEGSLEKLILTVKYHIFGPSALFMNNFRANTIYRLHMLGLRSSIIKVRRSYEGKQLTLSQLKSSKNCGTVATDIIAKNGVIHVIDCLLY